METKSEVKVELAGKKLSVKALPIRKDKAWREQVNHLIESIGSTVGQADFSDNQALVRSLLTMPDVAFDMFDTIFDLLMEYPEFREHQEFFEDNVRSREELARVFAEVISLSIPFDRMWDKAMGTWRQIQEMSDQARSTETGSRTNGTGTNLPAPSGASGTTKS